MAKVTYQAGKYQEGAIKLSSNESHFGISPQVRDALQSHINNIHTYPDDSQTKLKNLLAQQLQVSPEQMILGHGSDEIISFIAISLLEKNDSTLSAKETFSVYNIASQIMRATYYTVPLLHGVFDLETLQQQIIEIQPKIVFICNPNNPTGTYIPHRKLSSFISHIPHNIYVVLDEAYFDFVSEPTEHIPMQTKLSWHPNLIIIKTFSKLFALAGMRIGYGIASPSLTETIESVRMPFNINMLAQESAIASIQSMDFYTQVKNQVLAERTRMMQEITTMGYHPYPSETNFICIPVDVHNGTSHNDNTDGAPTLADQCFDFFAKHKIMVRSLTSFGIFNAIRVTIGTPDENEQVLQVLKKWLQESR